IDEHGAAALREEGGRVDESRRSERGGARGAELARPESEPGDRTRKGEAETPLPEVARDCGRPEADGEAGCEKAGEEEAEPGLHLPCLVAVEAARQRDEEGGDGRDGRRGEDESALLDLSEEDGKRALHHAAPFFSTCASPATARKISSSDRAETS